MYCHNRVFKYIDPTGNTAIDIPMENLFTDFGLSMSVTLHTPTKFKFNNLRFTGASASYNIFTGNVVIKGKFSIAKTSNPLVNAQIGIRMTLVKLNLKDFIDQIKKGESIAKIIKSGTMKFMPNTFYPTMKSQVILGPKNVLTVRFFSAVSLGKGKMKVGIEGRVFGKVGVNLAVDVTTLFNKIQHIHYRMNETPEIVPNAFGIRTPPGMFRRRW